MEAKEIGTDADGNVSVLMYGGRCFVHGSMLDAQLVKIKALESALREIARWEFDCPQHLEGAVAVEIAERALSQFDAPTISNDASHSTKP